MGGKGVVGGMGGTTRPPARPTDRRPGRPPEIPTARPTARAAPRRSCGLLVLEEADVDLDRRRRQHDGRDAIQEADEAGGVNPRDEHDELDDDHARGEHQAEQGAQEVVPTPEDVRVEQLDDVRIHIAVGVLLGRQLLS